VLDEEGTFSAKLVLPVPQTRARTAEDKAQD
jgi:hypothetical protein